MVDTPVTSLGFGSSFPKTPSSGGCQVIAKRLPRTASAAPGSHDSSGDCLPSHTSLSNRTFIEDLKPMGAMFWFYSIPFLSPAVFSEQRKPYNTPASPASWNPTDLGRWGLAFSGVSYLSVHRYSPNFLRCRVHPLPCSNFRQESDAPIINPTLSVHPPSPIAFEYPS